MKVFNLQTRVTEKAHYSNYDLYFNELGFIKVYKQEGNIDTEFQERPLTEFSGKRYVINIKHPLHALYSGLFEGLICGTPNDYFVILDENILKNRGEVTVEQAEAMLVKWCVTASKD